MANNESQTNLDTEIPEPGNRAAEVLTNRVEFWDNTPLEPVSDEIGEPEK